MPDFKAKFNMGSTAGGFRSSFGGEGGMRDHQKLHNRDAVNAHPITSISGLESELASKLEEEIDPTVPSWAKEDTKPSYTAQEVGALPDDTFIPSTAQDVGALPDDTAIPSKTSDLTNDSGFLTTETDPTVPSWAKEDTKPSYTAQEVGALPSSTVIPSKTSDLQNDSGFVTSSSLGGYMVKGVDYVTAGKAALATLGTNATAEGRDTYASGNSSHAEGYAAKATGLASHAEGYSTTASDSEAHAEGYGTVASERTAHAEGYETTASGMDSHAEGFQTISSGRSAHAEGLITTASGIASYAGGRGTVANHAYQHVFGEHNILDPNVNTSNLRGSYVEIVGNGTADDARSNARTLDWQGNETLAGKLTVGAGPTNNMDVATKTYVDTAVAGVDVLPSQTGQSGKFLTTNGSALSWGTVSVPTKVSDLTNDSGFLTLATLPIYDGTVI